MKLIVTAREHYYEGRSLKCGDVFEADPRHVELFVKLLKKAAIAPEPVLPVGEVATTQPPLVAEAEVESVEVAPRRTYRRRNLTAED